MSATLRSISLAALAALFATGCFSVSHKLPPHAYFGRLPSPTAAGETRAGFERSAMKNWLIAGLVPWSSFSSDDLLEQGAPGVLRYENLEVTTEFNALDTLIWIVPGQFYGYYVWAPRHITVKGDAVRSGAAAR
jgi:hypothetical protein